MTTETSLVPVLPLELQDQVIDCLHDDKPSLRKCALVARDWLPRVQHHLFRSIYIDWANCHAFTRLLASNSQVAAHVATLEIEGAFGIFSMDRLHGATLDAWLRAIPASFSHQLCNLTKLELALITIDADLVRQVFGRLAGITHLTLWACALTNFDLFVELITSYPRLTHLNIAFTHEWETCSSAANAAPLDKAIPQIEVVELTSSCDNFKVLRWLISRNMHTSIHTLSCSRVGWGSLATLLDILGTLSPSLQTLRIGFGDQSSTADPSSYPVFTPLSTLTSLTLDIHTNRLAATPYMLFLLSHLAAPTLRTLVFAVVSGEHDVTAHLPWGRIADATARVARSSPIQRIVVNAKDRNDDMDGFASGGFTSRSALPMDFSDMEATALEAFAAQGLERMTTFVRG